MALHLVNDAISLFDKFSEATSPDVLRDLIENAGLVERVSPKILRH
ncbi:hypothetical protein CGMCC3_g16767 [Colletotrichum fructicola]|nr:uncharacterized protein CGMCC3_g16767 [Colletotrichum fructicola]KAE9567074.1 hypothetical protein CGMCC3_g16767 [Colletotrichum fructicola]